MQLNGLDIDGVFEIWELGFAYRVSQTNKHDEMYNLISEKIIKVRFKSFEKRIKTDDKFKYKDTGDISVK
jgi:hypothetical protein